MAKKKAKKAKRPPKRLTQAFLREFNDLDGTSRC